MVIDKIIKTARENRVGFGLSSAAESARTVTSAKSAGAARTAAHAAVTAHTAAVVGADFGNGDVGYLAGTVKGAVGENAVFTLSRAAAAQPEGVGVTDTHGGEGDKYRRKTLGGGKCMKDIAIMIGQADKSAALNCAGKAQKHVGLSGTASCALSHARTACNGDNAAGDAALTCIVKGTVAAVGGAVDYESAAADIKMTVRVDAVTACVYDNRAAADGYIAVVVNGKHVRAGAITFAVTSACGINAVVGCGDVDIAAADRHFDTLDALIAFIDDYGSTGYVQSRIGVDAVITGIDGEAAAGNGKTAVAVQSIVGGVYADGAVFDKHIRAGLDTFGAGRSVFGGTVCGGASTAAEASETAGRHIAALIPASPLFAFGATVGTAAAGGDFKLTAADIQRRFCLESVLCCVDSKGAADDGYPTRISTVRIVGAQAVAACIDGKAAVLYLKGILAGDAVVGGVYDICAAVYFQSVLGLNTVVEICVDGKSTAAFKNEIGLAEESGIGLFLFGVVVVIFAAVGEHVLRAVGQRYGHQMSVFDVDGAAVGAGDIRAAQDKAHILAAGIHDYLSAELTGKGISSASCDGDGRAVYGASGRIGLSGIAAEKDVSGTVGGVFFNFFKLGLMDICSFAVLL